MNTTSPSNRTWTPQSAPQATWRRRAVTVTARLALAMVAVISVTGVASAQAERSNDSSQRPIVKLASAQEGDPVGLISERAAEILDGTLLYGATPSADPGSARRRRGLGGPPACSEFELGRVLVRFHSSLDANAIALLLDPLDVQYGQLSPLNLYFLYAAPDRESTLELLSTVRLIDGVVSATVDCPGQGGIVRGPAATGSTRAVSFEFADYSATRALTSDTYIANQWHLDNAQDHDIDAPQAWAITTGSPAVIVGVVDSGYDALPQAHPELAGRIYVSPDDPRNGVDDDGDGFVDDETGWDFVVSDDEPEDENGHGSWVLGVLVANTNNSFGIAGVDQQAKITPLKILDQNDFGFSSSLINALDYALIHPGIKVVSLSLIDFPIDPMIGAALDAVANQAILLSCAGNDGPGTADGQYPGAHRATISIAWTTSSDTIAPLSSTGSTVEFSAPGQDVVTLRPFTTANVFDTVYGCSFATPIVAGGASLTLAIRPTTDNADFRFLLKRSVRDLGPVGWDPKFGWGRLDLDDLLIEAQGLVFQSDFEIGDLYRWY